MENQTMKYERKEKITTTHDTVIDARNYTASQKMRQKSRV